MAGTYQVRFLPEGQLIRVPEGERLLDAAFEAGASIDAPCGGRGDCKKCEVEILSGKKTGTYLACQTIVDCNMEVRLLHRQQGEKILVRGRSGRSTADTGIRVKKLSVPPIVPGEPDAVWERVRQTICRETGMEEGALKTENPVLAKLYHTLKEGDHQIYVVLYENRLLDVSVNEPEVLTFAVDIGTTTLVGHLLDGRTGMLLSTVSEMNPQHKFGADVITRAGYAREHGSGELSACIREAVSSMALKAAEKAGAEAENIYLTAAVGNTCMHHLFLGLSPESLVQAPYSPVIREGLVLCQGQYLRHTAKGGVLKLLPNIAGFVGADTTACLLASRFDEEEEMTLLMDIGTNGEIVLGDKERSLACSTAAGPAFEGAKITCGMRGAIGAIDHVYKNGQELSFSVIGETRPQGICGSGLLDCMAVLVECGFVDPMGMLKSPEELTHPFAAANSWRIQGEGIKRRFMLYTEDGNEPVYITQKDISELQLAKAAMAAGIRILCGHMGVRTEEIRKVLVAGAFGNYMNPHSACAVGLIPPALEEKIQMIGNAAGEGAVLAVVNREDWMRSRQLAKKTGFAELACEPDFSDFFVEELEFPVEI